jgi:acrylyl-CoA reductase (NADPH)
MTSFSAFVAERDGDAVRRGVRTLSEEDLPEGEVTIRVAWSSVNYKDALATIPGGQVARISPLVPGIDLAGEVVAATPAGAQLVGRQVLVHGYGLGVAHAGGFAGFARVPVDWVVPLPEDLSPRQAMVLGTAGYTAALSIERLERVGLHPGAGPVLVTGATGGVGSVAVALLAHAGYEVAASTGKGEHDHLRRLGASEVLSRAETSAESERPLERERWAAVVDPVGGATLAYALRTTRYGGAVASSGNTGGVGLASSVFPFILRGVSLLGVDSVQTPLAERRRVWERMAVAYPALGLDDGASEVTLNDLEPVLDRILRGEITGRTVVRIASKPLGADRADRWGSCDRPR